MDNGTALPPDLHGYITASEVERLMGWAHWTRMRREREGLPVVKIGRALKLYPREAVLRWAAEHHKLTDGRRPRGRPFNSRETAFKVTEIENRPHNADSRRDMTEDKAA
jgi:hypothetical protein